MLAALKQDQMNATVVLALAREDERLRNFRAATFYSERFFCRCVLMIGVGRVIPL